MHKTNEPEPSFHYISTREEARKIIDAHDRFWVSNCGCREGGSPGGKPPCGRFSPTGIGRLGLTFFCLALD